MSEKRNVPKLRFPEFLEGWNEKNLGELLEFKNGYNAPKESYGSGEKFINVLDIIQNTTITHDKILGSVELSKLEFEKYKVEYGDILFQRSSETREEVGQANVYLDKLRPATFGGFVIRGKKIGDFVPSFMNYLLRTPQSRNEITSKSGGSTRYNVGQETLSQVPVILPSLPEQQKIAEFLTTVDRRIELLQAKKEKLEAYKKGVMQKIFLKQLRFKADDGSDFPDWEERKLGEVARIFDGTHQTPKYVEKGVPFYSVEHVTANQFTKTKYISEKVFEAENKRVTLEKGDILMTRIGSIGVARLIDWDVRASFYVSLALLKVSPQLESSFLTYFISATTFQRELWKRTIHVAFPQKINLGEIGECAVMFPSIKEQQKIARFLTNLDRSIDNLNQQINHTQTWKKGLLQKMFV